MQGMMEGMMGGCTWGMGIFSLLGLLVLVLAVAALIKYLFFSDKRGQSCVAETSASE